MGIAAIWEAVKLFGIWKRIGSAVAWVFRSALHLALAVAALSIAWGFYERHEAGKWQTRAVATKLAWDAARNDAEQAKAAYEAQSKERADVAQQNYAAAVADGSARVADYIASHRMRSPQANPASPGENYAAGVPAIAPGQTVMASISDLTACDADYSYALSAYQWAHTINAPLTEKQQAAKGTE